MKTYDKIHVITFFTLAKLGAWGPGIGLTPRDWKAMGSGPSGRWL